MDACDYTYLYFELYKNVHIKFIAAINTENFAYYNYDALKIYILNINLTVIQFF